VLFLWSQNLGEVPLEDVVQPLVLAIALAALATLGLAIVFGMRARSALIVTPAIFGVLMYGHVLKVLSAPSELLVAFGVLLVWLGVLAAWRLATDRVVRIDRALTMIGALLVGVSLVQIVPYQVEEATAAPPPVLVGGRTLPSETSARKRDVYWLVYDRYGSDRAMHNLYHVDNDLTPWLSEHGFDVLENSHANYVATSLSLSTTMNLAHLEELTGLVGSGTNSYNAVYRRLQSALVPRQFQALGYRYLHLGSWWNPTRFDEAADRNYNADGVNDFTSVLFTTSALPLAVKALGLEDQPPSEHTKHIKHNTYALDQLDRLRGEPGPKFVMAHILLPHPPYVFDRDGRPMTQKEVNELDDKEAGRRQLAYTNTRIRSFIEGLLALPEDQQPIIIVQADEGPWTDPYFADKVNYDWNTATPEDLETKFGILNAWYVPGGTDTLGLRQDQTAINTFPILFSRYFGLDGFKQLPDIVRTSSGWNKPYKLVDITDKLPSLR
jgi:Sulfatase